MKNLTQLFLGLLLLVASSNLHAQTNSDAPFLKLLAHPNAQADTMLLRWAVSDPATWKEGIGKGFTLIRMTTDTSGVALSGSEVRNSVIVLNGNLFPLSESEWDTQFPNNNFAKVAKGALYQVDTVAVLTQGEQPKLVDAVERNNADEGRFAFALFSAEQDFDVAKGLALAYCDPTIEAGKTYIYRLAINGTDIATAIKIESDSYEALPPIDTLVAVGGDMVVELVWDIASTGDYYSSYTVERSLDGVNFSPINNLPILFAAEGENDPDKAIFKDSINSNDLTYYYRVCGRTPFGLKGPASSTTQVMGMPPRISPFFITIDTHIINQGAVTLDWESFNDSLEFRLEGFNLYRTENSDSPFMQVNDSLMTPSTRSFTDINPLSIGYYLLEAVDDNNHGYNSPLTLVQLPDSIPPAIPIGLEGKFVNDSRVSITWQANTEPDLKGYRVFVANGANSNYVQVTSESVAKPQYVYDVDPNFIVDSIYIKVTAVDQRENFSEKSAYLAVKRPDIVPPSNPVLQKVNGTPSGIELGWRFSSSEDVVYHKLERKPINAPGWVNVLTINKDQEAQYAVNLDTNSIVATCYLDTSILERRGYEYRLLAFDQEGNRASSGVIPVRPFDSGKRGTIVNFEADANCLPVGSIDKQEGYDALERILTNYESTGIIREDSLMKLAAWNIIDNQELSLLKNRNPYETKVFLDKRKLEVWKDNIIAQINLMWGYNEPEQLQDFQIYRSANGSPIMLYKTLPISALNNGNVFLDEDVQPDRRYYYQIVARHADGGFSEMSKTLMVKVPKF